MDSEALVFAAAPGGPDRAAFTVTSGVHRGATFAPTEGLLLIGADTACDICLSDAGLASRHAAIVSQGSRVAIRRLEGAVSVNGEQLLPSESLALANGADITLGESGIRLYFAGSDSPEAASGTQDPRRKHTARDDPGSENGAGKHLGREHGARKHLGREHAARKHTGPENTALKHPGREPPADKRPRLPRVTAIAALAGLTVLVLALGGRQIQASRPAETSADVASVPAEDSLMREAELVAQVQDVFRASGYDAQISHIGKGELRVENLDAEHERVKRAVERVKADVPQLTSLTFASPGDSKPPEHSPPFSSAGFERMTVSISGSTGYLAADDGARYFVGSVLPGGITVRRITNDAVQVDRDGQISWYRF